MMKKILCVLLFLCACVSCAWGDVQINAENFPDDVFREYVRGKFDKDSDDILNEAEIARAEYITVGDFLMPMYGNISSLKGVEYFTALISLKCAYNRLTELDLSKNTALTHLNCSYNKLTELDLSKNVALIEVKCEYNQLTTIDISDCSALTYLSCNNNELTELDVSKNAALETLFCWDNYLSELDISKNTALTSLICTYNKLEKLDLSQNIALTCLRCSQNELTELDLSKNTALEILDCWYNHMAKLDLLINVKLYNVDVGMQNIRNLKPSRRNDGTYYTEMMNDYGMTPADLNRIIAKSVKGYDRAHHNISTYNATSGIVSFSSYPAELRYSYDTASGHSMDVIIKALPLILTEQPDDAYVDVEYSFKFKAGGAGKISWDIYDSSKLPQGLEFDVSKGVIEGTPKAVGEYKFSITASTYIGNDTKEFTLSVKAISDDSKTSPKAESNSGGGGGCDSVSGMIMLIGLCVLHGLKIKRRN